MYDCLYQLLWDNMQVVSAIIVVAVALIHQQKFSHPLTIFYPPLPFPHAFLQQAAEREREQQRNLDIIVSAPSDCGKIQIEYYDINSYFD